MKALIGAEYGGCLDASCDQSDDSDGEDADEEEGK